MPSLKEINAHTSGELIKARELGMADLFQSHFCLQIGDYLEIRKSNSGWGRARIVGVETCYANERGGWTAFVHLARLRSDGRLGIGRGALITVGGGNGLRGVKPQPEIRRIQSDTVEFLGVDVR